MIRLWAWDLWHLIANEDEAPIKNHAIEIKEQIIQLDISPIKKYKSIKVKIAVKNSF